MIQKENKIFRKMFIVTEYAALSIIHACGLNWVRLIGGKKMIWHADLTPPALAISSDGQTQ